MARLKTLILGGTTEARLLATKAAEDGRFEAVLSLAGVTKAPLRMPVPVRIGGFGGAAGLARHLVENGIGALVDATHPFAATMSRNAAEAAAQAGVPHLVVLRPAWRKQPGDQWRMVTDMPAAAAALGPEPRRVFLTVGRMELKPFVAAPQHHYLVRSVDPPPADALPHDAEVIAARGPFDVAGETRILEDHEIDLLVTKNSGGDAAVAKLHAARALGLPVVMIERPPRPTGETVETVEAALDWLIARHHEASARRGV